jgi:tetratricopeptide (TPR) repeat protein
MAGSLSLDETSRARENDGAQLCPGEFMRGVAAALALTMFASSAVCGDEPQDASPNTADALTREGTSHFRLNEFDAALRAYRESYRLAPKPELLFDIGQCYRKLDQKQLAIDSFKSFLQESSDEGQKGTARDLIEKLGDAIRQEAAAKNAPPQEPLTPAASTRPLGGTRASDSVAPASAVEHRAQRPIYKRWWFWTALSGVAAVAIGVGLGIGLSSGPAAPSVNTTAGTFRF